MNTVYRDLSRAEMIEQLVVFNQNKLRDIVTLTPEVISWLNVMAERETLWHSGLTDDQLATAYKSL